VVDRAGDAVPRDLQFAALIAACCCQGVVECGFGCREVFFGDGVGGAVLDRGGCDGSAVAMAYDFVTGEGVGELYGAAEGVRLCVVGA